MGTFVVLEVFEIFREIFINIFENLEVSGCEILIWLTS